MKLAFLSVILFWNIIDLANTEQPLNYNQSWIKIDASNNGRQLITGQPWQVPVDYYLDPSEFKGETTLYLWCTGPWIDIPDGKYATKQGHMDYPNMSRQIKIKQPGRGHHVFSFMVPPGFEPVKRNNPVLLVSGFRDNRGKDWPWNIRAFTTFIDNRGYFEIETDVPGNLFTYDERVSIKIKPKIQIQNIEQKTVNYEIYDTFGIVIEKGKKEFTFGQSISEYRLDLDIQKRGTFMIEIDIPGWEKKYTTFARIPDLKSINKDNSTSFGMTTSGNGTKEIVWAIAERLGFSICRRFTQWYKIQPSPETFNIEPLELEIKDAQRYGIDTWLCLTNPPSFAFKNKAKNTNYEVFDCNLTTWQNVIKTVTTELKGNLYGWEWLNELTPGGNKDQITNYMQMCKIGTETAKAIDPNIVTLLAGGLYPRSFRNHVLAEGIGKYIDVLPVHYQNGNGVLEARRDLDKAGFSNVSVWDNESAINLDSWAVQPLDELKNTKQCDWILKQWPDELIAGCEKIIYFGGQSTVGGKFGYILDDYSPRPVAATIAVLISKLANAKPLGTFLLGKGGVFHLFERDNKAILVASTYEKNGEIVVLNTGNDIIKFTYYQGDERTMTPSKGKAQILLNQLPFFIENVDIDILKAYIVPEIQAAQVGSGTSSNVASFQKTVPHINMLKGNDNKIILKLNNVYDYTLSGDININLPESWAIQKPVEFSLKPHEETKQEITINIPEEIVERECNVEILFNFDEESLPTVEKHVSLTIVSPENLGNLITNGDFESPAQNNQPVKGWYLNDTTKKRISSEGLGEGLGNYVLKFENSEDWVTISQNLKLQAGQTYLYTAWIRNENMGTGSNMTQNLIDGSKITLHDMQVISCGSNNPYWQLFTCRKQMPLDTKSVIFTPLAKGSGWAMWDNIRVTVFEGTDYTAEAYKTKRKPKIDGVLDENEWITKCPIPLIGSNQLSYKADDYQWTPDNLSAVSYMMWDNDNLYIAIKVRDNTHFETGSGSSIAEDFIEGDSCILGFDPTNRGPEANTKAFIYYISSSSPGQGSGSHTIFRPEKYSGLKQSGHLFKDSSVYDIAISHKDNISTYELLIPMTELDIFSHTGSKVGFSIQINDNDGGNKEAQINWGDGLYPKWSPDDFGIVTFLE